MLRSLISNFKFLYIFFIVCSVAQWYLTLWSPVDCSLPGSSVLEIFQTRILEWVATSYSRGFSGPRDQTHVSWVSRIGRQIPYHCAIWEAHIMLRKPQLGYIKSRRDTFREGHGTPLQYSCLENPREEPGRLQSMGSQRVGHN